MEISIISSTIKSIFVVNNSKEIDHAISISRIVAMIFIVLCHTGNHFNNAIVSQLFNLGVPIFFVISGSLYAKKSIDNPKDWLIKRVIRLYMPLIAWTLFYIVRLICEKSLSWTTNDVVSVILLLTNLQGLQHFFTSFMSVDGPWFFTIIMFCYIVLIPLKKCEKIKQEATNKGNISKIVALFTLTVLAYFIHVDLTGFFYFFFGYYITQCGFNKKGSNIRIYAVLILLFLSLCLRLIFKLYFDETWYYNGLIVPLTHVIAAFSIVLFFKAVRNINNIVFDSIACKSVFHWLDSISVYVYCFHGVFITGTFSVFSFGISSAIEIVILFVCVFILSTIVAVIFESIGNYLLSRIVN